MKAPRLKLLFVHADAAVSPCICVNLGTGEQEVAEWVAEASRKSYLSLLESCNRSRTSIKSCMPRNKEAASRIMPPQSGIHVHTATDLLTI